jgi:hypothetical protein
MSAALYAALRGDDVLMAAIDAADPDTYGVSCPCGCYYVGKFSVLDPADASCPECGGTRGGGESPALGKGPEAVRKQSNN